MDKVYFPELRLSKTRIGEQKESLEIKVKARNWIYG